MKQKIAYMSIGMVFTLILSFSLMSFASQSTEVVGNLTAIDQQNHYITLFDGQKKWDFTLDPHTVIYRNEEKVDLSSLTFTDQVKVLLNSNQEVRYVVATYRESAKPQPLPQPTEVVPLSSNVKRIAKDTGRSDILELELKIKNGPKHEYKLKYKNKKGEVESHLEVKMGGKKIKTKSGQAKESADRLIQQMALTPDMSTEEITEKVISAIGIRQPIREFELKIIFSNGKEMEAEFEHENDDKDRDD